MADTTANTDVCMDAELEVLASAPNRETITAMAEAERIAKDLSAKDFADLDALFADMKQ